MNTDFVIIHRAKIITQMKTKNNTRISVGIGFSPFTNDNMFPLGKIYADTQERVTVSVKKITLQNMYCVAF